jgi:multiple sugar transport system substrate-binding protein
MKRSSCLTAVFILAWCLCSSVTVWGATQQVQYSTWYGGALLDGLKAGLDAAAAKYMPGVSLEALSWGANEYTEKLTVMHTAGTAPEVIMTNSNRFFVPLAQQDAYAALDQSKLNAAGAVIPDLFQHFYWNGKLLAVPFSVSLTGMFVNLSRFQEAGLDNPSWDWDWNDLMRIAKRLTQDHNGDGIPDVYGLSVGPLEQQFGPFVYANGGSFMNRPFVGTEVTIDSPGTIAAVEFLQQLIQQERAGLPIFGFAQWLNGQVAICVDGTWQIGQAKMQASGSFDWDFVPYPRSPVTGRYATRLTIEALSIATDAVGSVDAWRLLDAAISREAQEMFLAKGTIAIPVRRDLMSSPYFYPPHEAPRSARRYFSEALTDGSAIPETVYPDLQMRAIMERYTKEALEGRQPARTAYLHAAQEMRALLK